MGATLFPSAEFGLSSSVTQGLTAVRPMNIVRLQNPLQVSFNMLHIKNKMSFQLNVKMNTVLYQFPYIMHSKKVCLEPILKNLTCKRISHDMQNQYFFYFFFIILSRANFLIILAGPFSHQFSSG